MMFGYKFYNTVKGALELVIPHKVNVEQKKRSFETESQNRKKIKQVDAMVYKQKLCNYTFFSNKKY